MGKHVLSQTKHLAINVEYTFDIKSKSMGEKEGNHVASMSPLSMLVAVSVRKRKTPQVSVIWQCCFSSIPICTNNGVTFTFSDRNTVTHTLIHFVHGTNSRPDRFWLLINTP